MKYNVRLFDKDGANVFYNDADRVVIASNASLTQPRTGHELVSSGESAIIVNLDAISVAIITLSGEKDAQTD